MTYRRLWWSVVVSAVAVGLAAAPHPADATLRFGALQVSGNLQSQNLIRTPDASTFEFIQNRNTAHIRLDYDWLQGGKFIRQVRHPVHREARSSSLLWRGVYDSIYDTTPGFLQKDGHPRRRHYGGQNVFDYATQVGIPTTRQPNRSSRSTS